MKKLYRSRRDKMATGLCGGLAEYLNVEATLLRVVVVIVAVFSTGVPILAIYIIASLVIPKEPVFEPPYTGGTYRDPQPPRGGSYTPPYNSGPYSHNAGTGNGGSYSANRPPAYSNQQPPAPPARDELDEMMKDIEKKALRREVEELKAKLAKFENEKGEN